MPSGMPGLTQSAARLALALVLVGAPAHTASRVAPTEMFDVYAVRIRIAELTVADDSGSRSYLRQEKNSAAAGPA